MRFLLAVAASVSLAGCGLFLSPESDGPCGADGTLAPGPHQQATLLTAGQPTYSIVADATRVYWVSAFHLDAAEVAGGDIETYPIDDKLVGPIAADDDALYVASIRAIYRVSKDGGTVQTLVTGEPGSFRVDAIAADATTIFWADGMSIRVVPKAGGPATTFAKALHVVHLAVDEKNVYWSAIGTTASSLDTGLFRAKRTDGIPARIALAHYPGGLVVAGGSVYWADYPTGVHRLDPDGTDRVVGNIGTRDVAADAEYVYATGNGPGVARIPLAGGAGEVVADSSAAGDSWPVALSGDDVVFGVPDAGAILQATKSYTPASVCVEPL